MFVCLDILGFSILMEEKVVVINYCRSDSSVQYYELVECPSLFTIDLVKSNLINVLKIAQMTEKKVA